MIIRRVRVEEGFLDDLDVYLKEGLNVIVGPRGAGKTSVVELVRFALGVTGYTENAERIALEHARSVLGSGEVTVTLQSGETLVDVSRTAEDVAPRATASYMKPIMLSQNEIESVGLAAAGRLRLIDSFRPRTEDVPDRNDIGASIRSLSVELQSLTLEIATMDEQLAKLSETRGELQAAKREQHTASAALQQFTTEQLLLQKNSSESAAAAVRVDLLERARRQIVDWWERVESTMAGAPVLESWPPEAGTADDALKDARLLVQDALQSLVASKLRLDAALTAVDLALVETRRLKATLDQSARDLRRILEQSQQGAGDIAKRVASLQQRVSQLTALQAARGERVRRLQELSGRRYALLARLDEARDIRYGARIEAAECLNNRLGPRIQVGVEKSGNYYQYSSAIAAALRGSGLHYNILAPALATHVSPRELVEAVEGGDAEMLASVAGISAERAMRLAMFMRTQGLSDILTAPLDDFVTFKLLDGSEYKDTEQLSTGQRCTVVLPILLAHDDRCVIVDQPEDHLDNGFIVDTVIKAIKARRRGQLIFTTHNANIPVLGEASHVIVLGSDGRRGFVRHSGSLDDRGSVEAITTIMEGGRAAFQKRAAFYGLLNTAL